jgi:2-dehydropantoate 2-reductase
MSTTSSIAIIGAGALGSYYGARLALSGADVRFLMRGDFEHVRKHGLTLRERDGTRHLPQIAAFQSTAEIGRVDIVVVALKTTANSALPVLLPPLVGPSTIVVTLQNGLGNEDVIASLVGAERVLGALCYIGVTREAAGEIVGHESPGAMTIGEVGRRAGEQATRVAAAFQHAGVNVRTADNLAEARWLKLIWNVPFNGLAIAGGGLTTDRILANPALKAEARALMEELAVAGRKLGYEVAQKYIDRQFEFTPTMGAYKPSSLIDFLAGREVEIEAIWGEPLRRARAVGVAMPRLEKLYAELRGKVLKA